MTLLIFPMIILISYLFTRLLHPLSMGLMLLIQTVFISVSSGMYTYSFWFSYILFLIFLGAMLILFIYVASLASNEPYKISLLSFIVFFLVAFLMMIIILMMDSIFTSNVSSLPPTSLNMKSNTPLYISWVYNTPSMNFTLFIILYLLLTLIVVVKITNLFLGPLRLLN